MDIGKTITNLLFEYNTVVLPGLGGFTLKQHNAHLDQARGIIQPASKQVHFNPNLRVDDGLLIGRLQQLHQLPHDTAEILVQNFVTDLKARIATGDQMQIEGLGTFYANGEAINFAPASFNYDTNAYGLSEVEATAIRDGQEEAHFTTASTAVTGSTTASLQKERSFAWLIGLAAAALVAVIIFINRDAIFRSSSLKEDLGQNKIDVPINQSPTDSSNVANQVELENDDSDIDNPTPSPGQLVKRVVVGAFSDRTNAEKLIEKIQKAGYTPFSEMRNSKRYVGITYSYDRSSQFERAFADIKREFGESAWILTD